MSSDFSGNIPVLGVPISGIVQAKTIPLSGNVIVRPGPVPFAPLRLSISNALDNLGVDLPLSVAGTYDFTVNWGDGSTEDTITAYNQAEAHHDYPDNAEYHITIRGTCTRLDSHVGSGFTNALKEVLAWGDVTLDELVFEGCIHLERTADGCRLNAGASMNTGFSQCGIVSIGSFIGAPSGFNGQLFLDCGLLESVGSIDLSQCTYLGEMVKNCASLSSFLGYGMVVDVDFSGCNLATAALNTIFSNLGTVSGKTITITGNPGAGTCNQSIATGKGWTVVN